MKCIKIEEKCVEYISFIAPRKSTAFQEDLYPDCPGPDPALQTAEWMNGKTSKPKTISMKPDNMPTKKQAIKQ
jgi:coronin-1B/1C/6